MVPNLLFLFEKLVGARGFEPPTPCSQSKCATRLRHAPTNGKSEIRISKLNLEQHTEKGQENQVGKATFCNPSVEGGVGDT